MKQTPFLNRAGRNTYFSMFLLLVLFITSCQKDASTNPETTAATPNLSASNLKPLAATPTKYTVSGPITLNGKSNVTISLDSINGGSAACITLLNCTNIHITNCKLINSKDVGVYIFNCTQVRVDYTYIGNVSTGVYAVNSKSVQVQYNQMKNVVGPMPRGQFVQFNNVTGTLNRISNNVMEDIPGVCHAEDAINLYQSSGTAEDPIRVLSNQIRGGGPSTSGGGINMGEKGGSYQTASYNTLVNPGQYGMAVSGGNNIVVTSNNIYSQALPYSNVGLMYWNQSGISSTNITMSGNQVNFTSAKYGVNNSYVYPGQTTPTGWSTNKWGAAITAAMLPTKLITMN